MVRLRSSTVSVATALVLSIALHVAVILPAFYRAMTRNPASVALASNARPKAMPMSDIQLGLEADTPSSYTWLGYDTFEEQRAPKAESEQAAFAEDHPGGQPSSPALPNAPTEEVEPQPEAQLSPPQTADRSNAVASPEVTQFPIQSPPEVPIVRVDPADASVFTPLFGPMFPNIEELLRSIESSRSAKEKTVKETDSTATEVPPQDPKTAPPAKTPNEQPAEASDPGKPTERPGVPADKESDATSIVEVKEENWKLGKPLASRGAELFTSRPDIKILTRLTSGARNPVVAIYFNAEGRAVLAEVVISSGDWRVDDAIRASLYKWKAKGEALSRLEGEDTFEVVLRYVISPGRDAK